MSTPYLERWKSMLVCPVDHSDLSWSQDDRVECSKCHFVAELVTSSDRQVYDFRARHIPQLVQLSFKLPVTPLDRYEIAKNHFRAINQKFKYSRQRYGTKLDKGHQYYALQMLNEFGSDATILDLGCGNGGNRRVLQDLGFINVMTVDWEAGGADILVDAHRLPFADSTFHLVISTAVFEHLYNPFVAMSEIGRILHSGGYFVGGASFWEAWHGSSFFHMTPDGWNAILSNAGLELNDLWPGWGIIPPALTHVLTPGYFRRAGYVLQSAVNGIYRLILGDYGVRKLQLRASGSFQVCARKILMN